LTWQQLGRHSKPILLANIDGFWNHCSRCSHIACDAIHSTQSAVEILKGGAGPDIFAELASCRGPRA